MPRCQNKRDAAHGGRSRFGIVPCGTVLPDFLSGLQLPQFRQYKFPQNHGQHTANQRRNDIDIHAFSSYRPAGGLFSFFSCGGSMSAFQIIGHDLPLIHVVLLMVDLLIGLMTLAGTER